MTLNNTIPMPSTTPINFNDYHCILVDALHPNIQERIRFYHASAKYAMIKSELDCICVYINGQHPVLLVFIN